MKRNESSKLGIFRDLLVVVGTELVLFQILWVLL